MPLTDVIQKFFVIQENSQASSTISAGPFFNLEDAQSSAQSLASKSKGVAFSVVRTTDVYSTDDPKVVRLKFTTKPGDLPA